eukprot:1274903-Heterocapsa_arctica.AAC.1
MAATPPAPANRECSVVHGIGHPVASIASLSELRPEIGMRDLILGCWMPARTIWWTVPVVA